MRLGNYHILEADSVKKVFFEYINALEIPIIDYVAIGVQDTVHMTSTSIMSNSEWQNTFKQLGLAKDDPIRNASFSAKTDFFSFDEIDHQNSRGKEVMKQRRAHEIANGFVIMRRTVGHNFMLTLATGYKNFNSYRFYIDKHLSICRIFDDLISLVKPATMEYQLNSFNHLNDDAKL